MIVLDHLALGARTLDDGWELFCGVLGGKWLYGGDSAGFWWGQLEFLAGPKIELLRPTGGLSSEFLERFLATRGPGPHHYNFLVPDIQDTLGRVRALGIEPVQVNLSSGRWQEAFLHPRDAFGFVIQVAQQDGQPPALAAPAELPDAGSASSFAVVEHHVADMSGALALFRDALGGEIVRREDPVTELVWPNGARIRLVQAALGEGRGSIGELVFARDGQGFSQDEISRAADLSKRLGVVLNLDG